MASNLAQGAVVATIPFLLNIDVTLLFVAILVNARVKQVLRPRLRGADPEIASDEELTAAMPSSDRVLRVHGDRVRSAGLLVGHRHPARVLRIDSLTFVVSALCIFFIRTRGKDEPRRRPGRLGHDVWMANNLKTGVRAIRDTPMLRSLFLLGRPGVLRVRPVERPAPADGHHRPAAGSRVRIRDPGGPDLDRFRAGRACSWPSTPTGSRSACGLRRYIGMGIAGILYGLSPRS